MKLSRRDLPKLVIARVQAGTILGRLGRSPDGGAPVLVFAIQPAGDNVRPIDPVPVLEGWESGTASAAGRPEPRPWGARLGARAARPRWSRDQGRIDPLRNPAEPAASVHKEERRICHRT
jgi:hypothetical protein